MSELRRQGRAGVLSGDDRDDLEFDQIGPLGHPALEQRHVVGLHELEASTDVGAHPAPDEREAVRHHPALVAEPAIDRLRILVAERFDDHEQHGSGRYHALVISAGTRRRLRMFAWIVVFSALAGAAYGSLAAVV